MSTKSLKPEGPPRGTNDAGSAHVPDSATARPPSRRKWAAWQIVSALFVVIASVVLWRGLAARALGTPAAPTTETLPTVAVARADREDLYKLVTIPAEFRPYLEVELHAKVSGYLQKINVDFGDKVKAGQLLGVLEVPELLDQLTNAIATEASLEANYTNAHLMFTRMTSVNKDHPNLVAQQDLDTAESKDSAAFAAIAGARAEMGRLRTLMNYTKITAPFDGVITHRYADPGALIQAGTASDTQSMPLVRLSDNYLLRLDFPVSVEYVKDVREGDSVDVRVDSLGGRTFTGKITRFTQKVDDDTRTMPVEIEVPNPNLEMVPGMYATAALKVQRRPGALAIPIQAVSSERKGTVLIVNQNGQVEERQITLGVETPDRYEVTSGLREGDLVLIAGGARVKPGEKVETKLTDSLALK